jgi:hypothetical protein
MKGYGWSLGTALVLLVVSFFFWLILVSESDNPLTWSWAVSTLVAAFAFYVAIAVWGRIGLALSKAKEGLRETLAQESVTILRSSWHYRLSERVCPQAIYGDLTTVRSECEYWARLANGLLTCSPVAIFLRIIGWFLGGRPNFAKGGELFLRGNQRKGPMVIALIVLTGAVMAVLKWGFPSLPAAPPLILWYIVGSGVGAIVLLIGLCFFTAKVLWPPLRNLASFAGARLVGACRLITFAD